MTAQPQTRRPLRRLLGGAATAALAAGAVLMAATPAHADIPIGWSDPEPVSFVTVLLVIVLLPLAGILLIAAAIYLPAIARGENVRPGSSPGGELEWFGGPRKSSPAEIAAPDDEASQAGGASGRW